MILETERLILTPFSEADGPLLYPLMSDDEVMAHLETDGIEDPDEVDATVAAQARAMAAGEAWYWTIRPVGSETLLGWVQLSEFDKRHHQAELVLMLLRHARGAGYALETMTAVVGYAATRGLRRLTARTQVGENRSEVLLKALGFEQLGYVRGRIDRDSERRDWRLWMVDL